MTSEPIDWSDRPLPTRIRDFSIGILTLFVGVPLALLAWAGVMIGIGMGVDMVFQFVGIGVERPISQGQYFALGVGASIVLGLLAWEYRNIIELFEALGAFIVALMRGHIRD